MTFWGCVNEDHLKHYKTLEQQSVTGTHNLINQFARSVERLAVDVEAREKDQAIAEHRKLRKSEKIMLQKMQLQRAIMTRYIAGHSFETIGNALSYHPKTIARFVRAFQTDLTILKEIDRDLSRKKVTLIEELAIEGLSKPQIVRRLHVSAHMVTAVAHMNQLRVSG